MKSVNLENDLAFNNLKSQYKVIYLQFSATWCGPCKLITPIVQDYVKQLNHPGGVYAYCDIDEFDSIAESLGINSIPAFCKYDVEQDTYSEIVISSNITNVKKIFNM